MNIHLPKFALFFVFSWSFCRKYQELTEGKEKLREFQQVTLKKLYDDGRRLEWKVPEGDAS